jgi:hypothetical protein
MEWQRGWEETINNPNAKPWIENKLARDQMGSGSS